MEMYFAMQQLEDGEPEKICTTFGVAAHVVLSCMTSTWAIEKLGCSCVHGILRYMYLAVLGGKQQCRALTQAISGGVCV